MKQFIKHIAILLFAFIAIATIVSFGSFYALRSSSLYKPSFLVNDVLQKEFDYIVLGSSVGLTTLNTKLIDSLNGTIGLNLSMDDTGLSSQYLMLEHFLAEGKTAKYCILAPGIAAIENKDVNFGDNDYRFLMFSNRDYVHNYYENAFQNSEAARVSYFSKWLPFVGVSYYNAELFFPSLSALLLPKKRNRFDNKGNYSYPKLNSKLKDKPKVTKKVSFNHPYLHKIEALCKANEIALIYYFAPTRSTDVEYEGANFPVLNHSQLIKDGSLFYDDIHVNAFGRENVSVLFAEYFKEFY